MGRYKTIKEDPKPSILAENTQKTEETINLNEFLSTYNRKRNLDNPFKNWFFRRESNNPKKTVKQWITLFDTFLKE